MPITLTDINVGATPGDHTGDVPREAFIKVNTNNATLVGAVLTQAEIDARITLLSSGSGYIGVTTSSVDYTLVLSDAGKLIRMVTGASGLTLTIPANASVAFPVDTRIDIVQSDGIGQVTVSITSDTLNGNPKTSGTWHMVSLWKRAATEWVVIGGILGDTSDATAEQWDIKSGKTAYIASGKVTGNGYFPPAMLFDGSTGYYSLASGLTSTGNVITAVGKFTASSSAADQRLISIPGAGGLRLAVVVKENDHANADVRNKLQFLCQASGAAVLIRIHSNDAVTDGAEYTYFFEANTTAGTAVLIINGSDELDTGNSLHTVTTGTIDDAVGPAYFGASNVGPGNFPHGGKMGFTGYRDAGGLTWSDFMQTDGTPKPLDETTWAEWGAQPLFWHEAGKMDENLGSAGAMTKNGTITLASAIP